MFRVNGSTIIEALVAMTITVIVFGAALTLFMGVKRDMNQPLKAKAIVFIGDEIAVMKGTKSFQPGKFDIGNIVIEKSFDQNNEDKDLVILTYKATRKDNGTILLQRRLIMFQDELRIKAENSFEQ